MVKMSNWNEMAHYLQKLLDEIGENGPCSLILIGGGVPFYQAHVKGKSDVLNSRPPTDDTDSIVVVPSEDKTPENYQDIWALSDNLNSVMQAAGIRYEQGLDRGSVYHDIFDPSFVEGTDTDEYMRFEEKIVDGKVKPIMKSKNGKVGLYVNLPIWKSLKEQANRTEDKRDLELMEKIGYHQ
jgi:hypothetical protein